MLRSRASIQHFRSLPTKDLMLTRPWAHLYQEGNSSKQGSPEFTPDPAGLRRTF